jgi:hypothetical protein
METNNAAIIVPITATAPARVVTSGKQVLVMHAGFVMAMWGVGVRSHNGRGRPMTQESCVALATEYADGLNERAAAEAQAAQIDGAE